MHNNPPFFRGHREAAEHWHVIAVHVVWVWNEGELFWGFSWSSLTYSRYQILFSFGWVNVTWLIVCRYSIVKSVYIGCWNELNIIILLWFVVYWLFLDLWIFIVFLYRHARLRKFMTIIHRVGWSFPLVSFKDGMTLRNAACLELWFRLFLLLYFDVPLK